MRRHLLIVFACSLFSFSFAQTDTIPLSDYRIFSQSIQNGPILNDSIDLHGKAFDPYTTLEKMPPVQMDWNLLQTHTASSDGSIGLSGNSIHTVQVSLLTTQYEEVSLIVECSAPYRVTLDNKEVGKRTTATDSNNLQTHVLKLSPSAQHTLALRVLSKDPEDIRVRLVPKLGKNSTLKLRTDAHEYMSMEFTQSGRKIYSVDVSPSGRYTILWVSDTVDGQSSYTGIVYKGNTPVSSLSGDLRSARWLSTDDKLVLAKKTTEGRALITYDPETLLPSTLHHSIPEGSFSIAPDNETVIFSQTVKGPEKNNSVDRILGRYDHQNFSSSRNHTFLFRFNLRTGAFQPLTYGFRSTSLRAIAPDSKEIIYSSSSEVTESPFSVSDYIAIDLTTMETDTLFAKDPHISDVLYTSQPHMLLVSGDADAFGGIGRNLPDDMIANGYDTQLFLYNRETGQARPLTKEFAPSVNGVRTSPDTFEAIFRGEDQDYIHLYRIDLTSGKISLIPSAEENIGSFSTSRNLKKVAYSGESANNSERFYIDDKCIYDLASERLKNIDLGEVSAWVFNKPDGQKVPGRFYLPPDFSPEKKYPLIVYYYGGTSPSSRMFSWYYSAPMYAAQDYVVLVLNPSGTTGWGQEYSARHVNAWGDLTADDIISAVKGFCKEKDYINDAKIGCFGASYGGFMTQYLLTQTDLFAAAMSHAGISAISSYWGQGTWGIGYSTVASTHSYPWNNSKLYTEHSPLFNADKINTPLLLLHGDSDTNVPYGESVQMYNALKILGKEVELVRVHGQDHHIIDPSKQRKWMQTTMAWFQKWLKDDSTWWDTLYPEVHL